MRRARPKAAARAPHGPLERRYAKRAAEASLRGTFGSLIMVDDNTVDSNRTRGFHYWSAPTTSLVFTFPHGFGFVRAGIFRGISVPHWFLALLFAILPAQHLRAVVRSRRRRRAGQCPRCGYDLRATPERCPECGSEIVLATDGHG